MSTKEEKTSKTAEGPDVIVVEPEEEPFPAFPPTEHPLLDVDYQHAPETAGLDYAGELVDEEEAAPKKGGKKDAADDR